ncbi:hypothetical protein C1646_672634 [Rhizophagus diaphanus]|nr:hypothetical protein C1646_672634 [Rhizophagus diaphanus] [Rhizophagus sp. MUCL 43196]
MNCKQIFTIFTILFVLLSTIVTSAPMEKRANDNITVSSPDNVIVQVRPASGGKPVHIEIGRNPYDGHLPFKIGKWNVKESYFVQVTVVGKPKFTGNSAKFQIRN